MVHRAEHNKYFTAMANTALRTADLSLKAKGLLAVCLSLPDDWKFTVEGLAAICKEGKAAIMNIVQELETAGYIRRNRNRRSDGKLGGANWDIYEIPLPQEAEENTCTAAAEQPTESLAVTEPAAEETAADEPVSGEPALEEPAQDKSVQEKPAQENRAQLNKDKQNKERQNKDLQKKEREDAPASGRERQDEKGVYGRYENVYLRRSDLKKLQTEFPDDWEERIEHISEYMAGHGKSYANPLAMIRKWAREDAPKIAKETEKAAKGQEKPEEKNSWEMKGVPYGGGGPGEHEIRAVRQLMKRHGGTIPVMQEAVAS